VFDEFMDFLNSVDESKEPIRRASLPVIAGYLATVAAGGTPSLGLAENMAARCERIAPQCGQPGLLISGEAGGTVVVANLLEPCSEDEAPPPI